MGNFPRDILLLLLLLFYYSSCIAQVNCMSTIQDLPCEVLESVFSYLPLATDQQVLCLVVQKMA
jgi:hypothetical protein